MGAACAAGWEEDVEDLLLAKLAAFTISDPLRKISAGAVLHHDEKR